MDNDNESNNENMELSPEEFYSYNYCENLEINEKNLVAKGKGKIHEEIIQLYSELKSAIHPSFIKAKFTNENEEIIESIREISFVNVRIDKYTIHILFSFLQKMKIISLILNSNFLTIKNLELIFNSLLTVPNHIFNLNFEWNSKLCLDNGKEIKINELNTLKEEDNKIFNLIISIFEPEMSRLESISFRGNYIGNEMGQKIFNLMKENTNIRILNLYKNNLSNNCLDDLCQMLLYNRHLLELNIGGNLFDDKTINKMKENIGLFEMNENELKEYEELVKLKEENLNFNKKNKNNKKVELKEIPFVDEMKVIEGKSFIIKNDVISKIDIIQNEGITQNTFNDLIYMIDNTNDLIFCIDLLKYNRESITKILDPNDKYMSRFFLCK
jgi:hypothetical protein